MKSKIIPARENESSVTIRLTPVKIGELLGKVKPEDYETLANAFVQLVRINQPHNEAVINSFIAKIEKARHEQS